MQNENSSKSPLFRKSFLAQELVTRYPPKIVDKNKQFLYQIASPPGCKHNGDVLCSRGAEQKLPENFPSRHRLLIEKKENFFTYECPKESDPFVEWYLNFANSDLFCAYGRKAFAQDEIQVAEHPVLGSLKEALSELKLNTHTIEKGRPTPILIMNVERKCSISTEPNEELGRPQGLYGKNFSNSNVEMIKKAIKIIDPPTYTNLIAIEAPSGFQGAYHLAQIEYILSVAYSGFYSARIESIFSKKVKDSEELIPKIVVHTGFWGCGAYGGNKVLMAILQIIAAFLAKIDVLVFHTQNRIGSKILIQAQNFLRKKVIQEAWFTRLFEKNEINNIPLEVSEVLKKILSEGFCWGRSDGN